MELSHTYQVNYNELNFESFDYFIAVSGIQNRSTYLINKLSLNGGVHKYLLKHSQPREWLRKNDYEKVLVEKGYKIFECLPDDISKIDGIINEIIQTKKNKDSINILIDYSCMPKKWYASIINKIAGSEMDIEKVNLFFSYTPPVYNMAPMAKKLKNLKPLSIGEKLQKNTKSVALILGLGSNKEMTQELIKRIKPEIVYCFYADPAFDERFVNDVMTSNKFILDSLDAGKIYQYPANNIEQIHSMLTTLSLDLRLKHKVVIAPLGPKTFILSSLFLSINYPDVELWEIETENSGKIDECEAFSEPIVFKAIFQREYDDDDY